MLLQLRSLYSLKQITLFFGRPLSLNIIIHKASEINPPSAHCWRTRWWLASYRNTFSISFALTASLPREFRYGFKDSLVAGLFKDLRRKLWRIGDFLYLFWGKD
ncbi:hypothetical protein N7530_002342 [Penicillium desertorum]|uniref:Uncharacterized protein n=1 Tax=Penicillium desertorum TaxID=1303715 RepID=A0A9X0BXG3_9EURO|nr:hypothetical protein N7530_002342 [Penicillium desertorum]